jgi:fluoroquinolone transport system permease protein
MTRLLAAMKTDVRVQVRNRLYTIGICASALVAVGLSQLADGDLLAAAVPAVMLLVGGGSTLLYVAAMILFEKDEGTLRAVIVSPLRTSEYLTSKIVTLTILFTVEAVVMIGGAMLITSRSGAVSWPSVPVLALGIAAIAVLFTLIGIVLIVRYDKITDFLMPAAALAGTLQVPFLYFWGVVEHPILLVIPTSAPTMLIQGAFVPLTPLEWVYAVGYTGALLGALSLWSCRAFHSHVVMNVT